MIDVPMSQPTSNVALTLDRERRQARFGGVLLALDSGAYEVLQALVDADGAVLDAAAIGHPDGRSKLWLSVVRLNEALARVAAQAGEVGVPAAHPSTHPSTYVASLPGQGYQLVHAAAPARGLLGRAAELARVGELLRQHRFVTIAGPGGMGKTTLARAVAAQLAQRYPDGVRFIDLAVLAEGRELTGALGAALGLDRLTRDGLSQLPAFLQGKRMLILFDCCEHHTAVAAHASEALLRAVPGIHVLCTSREPLMAQSERIVRLGPMLAPAAGAVDDVASAARSPAVQLFLARASNANPAGLPFDAHTAPLICAVCRAVEGVPLALELAAALVWSLGLETLARQTSKSLLSTGAAAAQPSHRHHTVSDMLDWSYDSLAPQEQAVMRSLAIFRGGFTLEASGAVAASGALDADSVVDMVLELGGKSLVSMHTDGGPARLRLLDLTREYAYAKLAASGELQAAQERHARWLDALMDRLEQDWMDLPRTAWLETYSPWVDDILAATDWALGAGDQVRLGARLAAVGFSLGDQIGLAREFHQRVQSALKAAALADLPVPLLMRLHFVNAGGPRLSTVGLDKLMGDAESVTRLARKAALPMLHGVSLIAIWGSPYVRGDYPASLSGARRIGRAAAATDDRYLALIGQRTMAQSLHFMGRHAEAHRCADRVLADSDLRIPLAYQPSPLQVGISMRIILARVLWMEGRPDQALAMSQAALALAESDRPSAGCQVLAMAAIPVALWRGETASAMQLVRQLRERATGHGLGYWLEWGQRIEDAMALMAPDADPHSLPSMNGHHDGFAKCRDHFVTFATALLTDDAARRCQQGMVAWCLPELLRAQAVQALLADKTDQGGTAAALLQRSMAVARRQRALAWSLRSATSLAALYGSKGEVTRARALLKPLLARCHEGAGTADLRAALALMASLEAA